MSDDIWRKFQRSSQYIFGCMACILNTFLILLIIFKSPKKMGNYRYLMIYISVFEVFYAIFDMILEPSVQTYGVSFFVFIVREDAKTYEKIYNILIAFYCGCFGFSLAIFGVHFIYRYGAVERNFRHKFLNGYKFVFLFFVPVIYGAWWGSIVYLLFKPTPEMSNYIRNFLLLNYDLQVENIAYAGPYFWPIDSNVTQKFDEPSFIGIGQMIFMIISSMFCIFYFGIKCYSKISQVLIMSSSVSNFTRKLQGQLFNALVAQTVIPLVLMHIPAFAVFFCPMLNIELGFATRFIGVTIAIYPGIDPLPTMFIIRNYRDAVKDTIMKLARCSHHSKETIEVD